MADCKPIVSRKRKAEPLAEQQSQLLAGQCVPTLLGANSPALLSDALAYARHHYAPPPAKRLLPVHSSASSSCGSLLDESSRGEFSVNGDICSELDFTSDAASRRRQRHETSLGQLTKKFVALLDEAADGEVNLNDASSLLKVQKRRIYDITNVLEGVGLLHKTFKNKIKWVGRNGHPEPGSHAALAAKVLSSGRCNSTHNQSDHKRLTLQAELRQLESKEKELERKMSLAMNHLQQLTEDEQNKRFAFLTYLDIKSIDELSNQTVIAIKAPSETKLEVPDPREKLQMWLKSDKGEIEVYICPEHAPSNTANVASTNGSASNQANCKNQVTNNVKNPSSASGSNNNNHAIPSVVSAPVINNSTSTGSTSSNTAKHSTNSNNHHHSNHNNQRHNHTRNQTTHNNAVVMTAALDSSDSIASESLDSGLDSMHPSHSNNGHSSTGSTLKHAFISEDDDLGLMGARDLQMQTDDQSALQHNAKNNSNSLNAANGIGSNRSGNCSPAPMNDLLFLHLQPPLSEDDYNFALEDSEGIADLFGEMLPTYK